MHLLVAPPYLFGNGMSESGKNDGNRHLSPSASTYSGGYSPLGVNRMLKCGRKRMTTGDKTCRKSTLKPSLSRLDVTSILVMHSSFEYCLSVDK